MEEGRLKRLIVAGTVTAVLLVIILISVMIYQLISISVMKKEEALLDQKIKDYEQLIEDTSVDIDTRSEKWWIEQRARELGYLYGTDHDLS